VDWSDYRVWGEPDNSDEIVLADAGLALVRAGLELSHRSPCAGIRRNSGSGEKSDECE